MNRQRFIMHIDMDAFFPAVETVMNPGLKGKPVIVGGGPTDRGVVASASYEARKFGVHAAMPLARAYRLCPKAIFLSGNFKAYKYFSDQISQIFLSYTPDVEKASLDEGYLDFTSCGLLYPSIPELGMIIQDEIAQKTGLSCSVGLASGKAFAKIASDYKKPHGFVYIKHGEEKEFIADMPIRDMPGIGEMVEANMHRMGIFTLGELSRANPDMLLRQFGVWGKSLWEKANGIDESSVQSSWSVKSISRNITFDHDTRDQEKIAGTLTYLLDRVSTTLRKKKKQARVVTITLRYSNFDTITRQQTLSHPTANTQVLQKTMFSLLHTHLQYKNIRLVGIGVSHLSPMEEREHGQQFLVPPAYHYQEQKLYSLNKSVDRIREAYGFASIESARELALHPSQKRVRHNTFERHALGEED